MTGNASGVLGEEREFLICTTFREFDGGVNSQVQQRFLESLKQQTYSNYKLIVTNYREKLVHEALINSGLPFEFHQSSRTDCFCCWTEVIANAFQYISRNKQILIWTNADHIFKPDLLSIIADEFEPNIGGTSFPHIPYYNLKAFDNNQPFDRQSGKPLKSFLQLDPNYWIPDTIFIDGNVFINQSNRNLFESHVFKNRYPGIAQSLVLAFFATKLINIYYRSKIAMIENVRVESNTLQNLTDITQISEKKAIQILNDYFNPESEPDIKLLKEFCKKREFDDSLVQEKFNKLNQNKQYKVIGGIQQKLSFRFYFSIWLWRHRGFAYLIPMVKSWLKTFVDRYR